MRRISQTIMLVALGGAALAAEQREPVLVDPPVTHPSPKQLVISESPGMRAISRLQEVKNATVVIDTRNNYLKGLALRRLRGLHGMPLRVELDDVLLDKHVRQVRFLGGADIDLRISERFIEDDRLIGRLHDFGPVRLQLDAPVEIAVRPEFWTRVIALKRVSVLVRLEGDRPLDEAEYKVLAARPGGVSLCLAVQEVPVGERLESLLRARPDSLRIRIDKPEALNWKLIDDLNGRVKVPKIMVVSPTSLSDDGVVRLNGVQGVIVRVQGAGFLGVDSVQQLNRIGQ